MKSALKIFITLLCSPVFIIGLEAATIESLSKRINKYGKLAELHLQRAQLHINNKDFEKAGSDLNRAILLDPKLEEAQLFLAEILIEEQQIKQSRTILHTLLKVSKNKEVRVQAFSFLGDTYKAEDKIEEALYFYKKIHEEDAVNEQMYYIKTADAYYELGNFRSAIKTLKMGLSSMIKKDLIKERIVDISMSEGHYTLSMSMLDEMITEDNNSARLYYKRAKILKEQGKIKEMNLDIKKARLTLLKSPMTLDENRKIQEQLKELYASL